MTDPRIGSLCSGMGGLDLAVMSVLGGAVVWHCEVDPDASRVLAHHWPGVPNHGDIIAVDWAAVESVDVLTAGYPCQPDSDAGQKRSTEDERWIWPAVEAAIRDVGPRLVVLENVGGHVGRSLRRVLGGLAGVGYDAVWGCVRAEEAGGPHHRKRVFIVARPATADPAVVGVPDGPVDDHRVPVGAVPGAGDRDRAGDPAARVGELGRGATVVDWGKYTAAIRRWERILGQPAPRPIVTGQRGGLVLNPAFTEWMFGLPVGWVTAVPGVSHNAQHRILGNGVVPRQAALALRLLLPLHRAA